MTVRDDRSYYPQGTTEELTEPVRITSLASGLFSLKMARGMAFRVANSLMIRFEPDRVRVYR